MIAEEQSGTWTQPGGTPNGQDLHCPDASHRNFTVRSPDPHGFDGDNDGVGCET